ncbi:UFE1 [Candida oxycetoniae]|uniref:UFE1 n=1 Tax=Candida oxycetoniae TaxID=497107 RepID=A0AAI9T1Y7_9ASCO|nr:UFE1 [Candida oxycetoniae]KAI3406585.2 UFE1 [Candida oxycetoniae]
MPDLTPQFQKCVDIVESEVKFRPKSLKKEEEKPLYLIKDTFLKECLEFYQVLANLNQFTVKIKSDYLAITDSTSSLRTKDKIDEDFSFKVQQCFKKLSMLEEYETKRQNMVEQHLPKNRWFPFSNIDDEQHIYFTTLAKHRMQILRFLMENLNHVNKKFELMQRKRISREKQLNLLNFQNIDEDEDIMMDESLNKSDVFTNLDQIQQKVELDEKEEGEGEGVAAVNDTMTQQQLQELEVENKELLNLKSSQLKQVDKIQQSIMDIINIQNELSFKLQEQGNQINNLMDSHSQVEMEVAAGNKNLNQATRKNKRGTNYLVSICIILGCLLVIIDFLKFI